MDTDEESTEPLEYGVGTRIHRYELLQRLGEGGFGTVYMAEQTEPVRRTVALKALRLSEDEEHVRSQPPWRHPHYWASWHLWGLIR